MGNDKGISAPVTSLRFTETQNPTELCTIPPHNDTHQCHEMWWNWTQEFKAAIFSEQSDMRVPRKGSLFLIDWSPRTAIQRNTPHLCLQYNTTAREDAKSHNNVCCNLSKVFSHCVSLFDFICVNSVQCLQFDRDLSATKPRSSNSSQ